MTVLPLCSYVIWGEVVVGQDLPPLHLLPHLQQWQRDLLGNFRSIEFNAHRESVVTIYIFISSFPGNQRTVVDS